MNVSISGTYVKNKNCKEKKKIYTNGRTWNHIECKANRSAHERENKWFCIHIQISKQAARFASYFVESVSQSFYATIKHEIFIRRLRYVDVVVKCERKEKKNHYCIFCSVIRWLSSVFHTSLRMYAAHIIIGQFVIIQSN